ncbi:MAG: UDP-N-acetylmuramoyl-L-alanine--D-glutamate ligase [Burkholderiaceae bacterium]|nr:UDP-N-acetylmuramoyl-L-alanine--D-glutamate ligase [Burkholderiaceae bacterium]MCD8515852.1 UDP-N-acetylmuramoyl-L-alanine--D-glutamate ligase [Burkholderiaceae bacterium]MCD8565733.1 UDP-N-acetylmuramoyl-L-alanine--D-glutamate ligase [Burkholderiaceae bacterium]
MNETVSVSLPGSRYLVLGLGLTGQAVARWLARQGCALVLVDTRADLELDGLKAQLTEVSVKWHLGGELGSELFAEVDTVVVSPGLSPHQTPIGEFLQAAQQAGKPVIGDIELFAQALESLEQSHNYQPAVLAVTGTNGKTTVTALARHMFESCGLRALAAGNIAPPVLDALADVVSESIEQWPQAWVLELSSFQLHYTKSLAPKAAVVLNLTQDHLDWHASFEEYQADKARIFTNAEVCIVNRDDPLVARMVESLDHMAVRSFGLGAPMLTHDVGLESNHDVQWLVSAEPEDFEDQVKPVKRRRGDPPPRRQPGRMIRLMPADALPMVGIHNTLNVMAAALLCRAAGGSWAPILKAAGSYHGEPHRMQFVRTVRDVDFYNDSKGTNVGATVAAVAGLSKSIVLIAGGLAKGQDFSPLAQILPRKARHVVLIGQDATLIESALAHSGMQCQVVLDMASAVRAAFELAHPGQAVLLSPACASFDMFSGYGHRGQVFMDEVTELALSLGEVA